MQFIHEVEHNPVLGNKEIVKVNGLEIPIAEFLIMEPEYSALPAGTKGINYVPGEVYYAFNDTGNVIACPVSMETIDGFLANHSVYASSTATAKENESIALWDTGLLSTNRTKRIKEIKKETKDVLAETDWYFTRNQENNGPVPQAVKDYRTAIRLADSDSVVAVNALTVTQEIRDVKPVWPVEPEGI